MRSAWRSNGNWESQSDGSFVLRSGPPVPDDTRSDFLLYVLRPVAGKPTRVRVPQAWLQAPARIELLSCDGWAEIIGAQWHLQYRQEIGRYRRTMPRPLDAVKEAEHWTDRELSPGEAQEWALEVVADAGD